MERRLPDWLDGYMTYTYETESRELYRKWVGVSIIAAGLRRKCHIVMGRMRFYPNLYIVLVGPPAARKGTAMEPGQSLLRTIGIAQAADESSRQKLIQRLRDSAEQLSLDNQLEFHSSLTIWSSELTVFLGYSNVELLTMLCKWFDCESRFQYETIGRGLEEVSNVWVNLIGATTPTLLQTSLTQGAVGSGFTSRTIFVFEEDKDRIIIAPTLDNTLEPDIIHDLELISAMSGTFKPDTQFFEAYTDWRIDQEKNPPLNAPSLAGYLERRQVFLLKLATIFSASRGNSRIVTLADFERAANLLKQTEVKMPKVFQGIGLNKFAEVQVRIMDLILKRGCVTIGELMGAFISDVTKSQLTEIVTGLHAMGFCTVNPITLEVKAK